MIWVLKINPAVIGLMIVFATYNKFRLTTLSYIISTSISPALASLYEIIEWLSSKITRKGKITKRFLGMQGDMYDAQCASYLSW